MGVVIKQSFWASLITYAGVIIGYVNSLILLPYFLDKEHFGLVRLVQSNGMMLIPLAIIGMNGAFTKFYPQFKENEKLVSRIISLHFVIVLLGSVFFTSLILIFRGPIEALFTEKSSLYNDYFYAAIVIFISQSIFNYFISYTWSKQNIILTNFLNEIFLRLFSTVLICLYGFGFMSFSMLVFLICISYVITTLVLLFYLFWKYRLSFDWKFYQIEREWIDKSFKFGSYTLIVTASASILMNIGYSITASLIGLEASGILTISVYIGTIVELPKRAVMQIISPIITQDFNDKNHKGLERNYQKASINLGILGTLLSLGIVLNLDSLFALMPAGEAYSVGYWLIVIICISKLLNMIGGVSPEIFTYSSFYKLNYLISPLSAAIIIALNLLLIPRVGIIGSGLSSLATVLVTQIIRQTIIYRKLNLIPYNKDHLKLLLVSIVTLGIILALPEISHPIYSIVFKSTMISVIFVGLVFFFNVSQEINQIIKLAFSKIGLKI